MLVKARDTDIEKNDGCEPSLTCRNVNVVMSFLALGPVHLAPGLALLAEGRLLRAERILPAAYSPETHI